MNAWILLLLSSSSIEDIPGVIGLLEVPAFREISACEMFAAPELPVFLDRDLTNPMGRIVGRRANLGDDHGIARCMSYRALLQTDAPEPSDMPQEMYGYEELGFVVIGAADNAFQIRTNKGSVWLASHDLVFHPVEQLLKRAYFVEGRKVTWCHEPGIACQAIEAPTRDFRDVVVRDVVKSGEATWLNVHLHEISDCHGKYERDLIGKSGLPAVLNGWVRMRDEQDRLNFWFYPKGC